MRFPLSMTIAVAIVAAPAFASIHHTKAQEAYFAEHEKCAKALRESKKSAQAKPPEQRKAAVATAKDEYARCEAWARLVWKYYPNEPPKPAAAPKTAAAPKPRESH